MVELVPYLALQGETFSPYRAEIATGLELRQKSEPGDIGSFGRYRGVPTPYGFAVLEPPDSVGPGDRLTWLLTQSAPHAASLRELGAELLRLHVSVQYWDQCNFEFTPGEVVAIAALSVTLTISCWDCTDG